ncbi:hypothetical protein HanIR_Chr14g0692931 [Helianthus annuus]|nr:hypothetical protein HanIR_Chr14g0692931 [Helianthus annuus]
MNMIPPGNKPPNSPSHPSVQHNQQINRTVLLILTQRLSIVRCHRNIRTKMVASWRVNLGFLGWRMAQVIKKVKRTMKAKMRKKEQSLRRSFWDLFLWWVHSLTDMVVVVG